MFEKIFSKGKFEVGVNYWASHAGTEMWNRWDESVVESDFARLAKYNMKVVRVFPLWSDFQPIKMYYKFAQQEKEIRVHGKPLDPSTPEGLAGIDPVMIERFEKMCRLAEKYNLKLIVGLITGWMSGRIFAPSALERLNLITDDQAILWEIRFVRYMVNRFKNEKTIFAWDLGNECNCMGPATRPQYVRWIADISMAIRCEDSKRPVVSGMHGIFPDNAVKPTPSDMREFVDVMTTHPYPLFTRHCNTDPMNEMKSALHATAESRLYADLSSHPCIVEEIGVLGDMMISKKLSGDYIRASALSSWAHDLRSFIWWCANEQSTLEAPPYDWGAVERELGIFNLDGSPKPACISLSNVQCFVDSFEKEFGSLPERLTDAVCIITRDQDSWGVAFGTFMLAKQAGLDITFAYADETLPDASTYLMPSIVGDSPMNKCSFKKILDKVENGATLYISNDSMIIDGFENLTGNCVDINTQSGNSYNVDLPSGGSVKLQATSDILLHSTTSKVICCDENGTPAFTVNSYGKGKVYYCNYPIEKIAGTKPGVISGKDAMPLYRFYEAMNIRNDAKCATSDNQYLGITEHPLSCDKQLLVLINYDKNDCETEVKLDSKKLERFIPFNENTSAKATD
ncbi:MAG: beta-mannanase, partial [Clostridia bacterium]|nr:beta-mannanase [Clostridia bacterium]